MQDRELYSIEEARALLGGIAQRDLRTDANRIAPKRRDRTAAVHRRGFNQRLHCSGIDHGVASRQRNEAAPFGEAREIRVQDAVDWAATECARDSIIEIRAGAFRSRDPGVELAAGIGGP